MSSVVSESFLVLVTSTSSQKVVYVFFEPRKSSPTNLPETKSALGILLNPKTLFLTGAGQTKIPKSCWVVVSNMFYVHPYLGNISNLTNIFQGG